MNIWIINQAAGRLGLGWGERHFYLSKEFIRNGHSVTIFSSTGNHLFSKDKSKNLANEEIIDGVKFIWIKTIGYKKSKSIKRIIGWFEFIVKLLIKSFLNSYNKPDKIIVSSSPITPILAGIILKNRFKAELIFEIRDIWPLSLKQLGNYSDRNILIKFLSFVEKKGYIKSDKIVGVMKYGNLHITKILKKEKNYYWIPNGFAFSQEDLISDNVSLIINKISEFKRDNTIIGYIGTIGLANNIEMVIDLSKYLKNCYFVLIGDGPEKEKIIKIIEKQNIKNIIIFEKVPKEQLSFVMPYFDFGIISWKNLQLYEYGVSANKYFDYMYFGKPVISIGKIKGDPVEIFGCGVKVNGTTAQNAKEIKNYIRNVDYDKVSQKAINNVKKYHSFSYLANKYLKILNYDK
jgi:hypothetical protein